MPELRQREDRLRQEGAVLEVRGKEPAVRSAFRTAVVQGRGAGSPGKRRFPERYGPAATAAAAASDDKPFLHGG